MSLITSVLGSVVGIFLPDKAYWAAKLSTGKWVCELDSRYEIRSGQKRPFDWTLDLIDTGDIKKIRELWLFCPPNPANPFGQTARLPITEPGTAFQFKVANVDAFGGWGKSLASQVIGRVVDKHEQTCECFVWDAGLNALGTYNTTITHFGSWRDGIAPQQHLSHEVLGLSLD